MSKLLLTLIAVGACSKAPTQYSSQPPAPPADQLTLTSEKLPDTPTNPEGGKVDGRKVDQIQESVDDRIRENANQPMTFGKGAAGISFATTYEQSLDLLSDEEFVWSGLTYYREGLLIAWRTQEPRKPVAIIVLNGYLGDLTMPPGYKQVKMGTELKEYFNTDEGGHIGGKFISDFYRFITKSKADSRSCFDTGGCAVQVNEQAGIIQIVFSGYGMLFVTNDERKALSTVLLQPEMMPLLFKTDLLGGADMGVDLLEGSIKSQRIHTAFGLNQSWGDLSPLIKGDGETISGPSEFLKLFDGMSLWFTRSRFDKNYVAPVEDERLTSFELSGSGMGTNFWVKVAGGSYEVKADGAVAPKTKNAKAILSSNINLTPGSSDDPFAKDRKIKETFTKSMTDLLRNKITISTPASEDFIVFPSYVHGQYSEALFNQYTGTTGFFNKATHQGKLYSVSTTMDSTSVNFSVAALSSDFDEQVFTSRATPVKAGSGQLGGFQLSDVLILENLDLSRNEVTVIQGKKRDRATFTMSTSTKIGVDESDSMKEVILPQSQVSISGVSLGIKLLDNSAANSAGLNTKRLLKNQQFAQIIRISTNGFATQINDLCPVEEFAAGVDKNLATGDDPAVDVAAQDSGDGTNVNSSAPKEDSAPKFHFGMLDNEFFNNLNDPKLEKCRYFVPVDDRGLAKKEVIYFPENRLKVIFSERQLSSISIY